jgi:ABC-type uncharacterized transport system substrate-binding protein
MWVSDAFAGGNLGVPQDEAPWCSSLHSAAANNPFGIRLIIKPNPVSPDAATEIKDVEAAAQANNISIKRFNASTSTEIDAAFASIAAQKPQAFLCGSDPFFVIRREQVIEHAARLKIPAIYPFREFPASGGLISYGYEPRRRLSAGRHLRRPHS